MPIPSMRDPIDWPDELQTLETLSAAAGELGGSLAARAGGSQWELALPGSGKLAVVLTGEKCFPLAIHSARWPNLVLGATDNPDALALILAEWRSPGGSLPNLAELCGSLTGWKAISTSAQAAQLARVDQSNRGWPASAQVKLEVGAAAVTTLQAFKPLDKNAAEIVEDYLSRARAGVVELRRLSGVKTDSHSGGAVDQIQYQITLPIGLLSVPFLEAALTLLGRTYHRHAPALEALANYPSLHQAYRLCNRAGGFPANLFRR